MMSRNFESNPSLQNDEKKTIFEPTSLSQLDSNKSLNEIKIKLQVLLFNQSAPININLLETLALSKIHTLNKPTKSIRIKPTHPNTFTNKQIQYEPK